MALALLVSAAAAARLEPLDFSGLVHYERSALLPHTQAPYRSLAEWGSGTAGSGTDEGSGSDDEDSSSKTGTIIGIALGAAAGACMLGAAVFYLFVIKPRSDAPPNPYQDAKSQELAPPMPSSAASPTYGGAYDRACGGATDTRATPPRAGGYGGPAYSGGAPGGSGAGPAYGSPYSGAGGGPTPPGVPASRV